MARVEAVQKVEQLISTLRTLPAPLLGHPDARARTYGAQLASAYSVDVFHDVLALHGAETDLIDLFACWTQELVMRDANVGGPHVDTLVETLIAIDHPLGTLPLHLVRPIESHVFKRSELVDEAPFPTSTVPEPIDADPELAAVFLSQLPDDVATQAKHVIAAYALEPPQPYQPPDGLLLRAIKHPVTRGALLITVASFDDVLAYMIEIATEGGCENRTRSHAYGRYYAWRSLAAFAGKPRNTALVDVAAECEQMGWSIFTAKNPWWHGGEWDCGVAAISVDGRTLKLFAGTDGF